MGTNNNQENVNNKINELGEANISNNSKLISFNIKFLLENLIKEFRFIKQKGNEESEDPQIKILSDAINNQQKWITYLNDGLETIKEHLSELSEMSDIKFDKIKQDIGDKEKKEPIKHNEEDIKEKENQENEEDREKKEPITIKNPFERLKEIAGMD